MAGKQKRVAALRTATLFFGDFSSRALTFGGSASAPNKKAAQSQFFPNKHGPLTPNTNKINSDLP